VRFTTFHLVCPSGHRTKSLQWDTVPFVCQTCDAPADIDTPTRAHGIVPDDIPGGLLVPHAICHADGSPKRYYSRSEMDRAARARGWVRDGETPK
jgi:hypothetical protein